MSKGLQAHQNHNTREPIFKAIGGGVRFVFQRKEILAALTLDMFSVLFGGVTAILPMFSDQILRAGSQGLGFLRSSFALGQVFVSLGLMLRPMREIRGKVLLWVVAGFGVCMLGFGISDTLLTCMIFLFVGGGLDSFSMTFRASIIQLLTPDDMKGRVSSVSSVFISSSNQLGEFESGMAAGLLGLVPSLVFGSTMTLLVVAFVTLKSPELRRLRIGK
jgi:hypothetical protein